MPDQLTPSDPRELVALGRRILWQEGCDSNVGGQLTLRDAAGRGFWATGFTYFDQGGPADVALLDWDLAVRDGSFPLAAAMGAHRDVYRRRPDVSAVVHLHSPHVVALSSTGEPVGMYDVSAVCFAGEQAIHQDDGVRPHASVVDSLGPNRVVLMRNHGALVVAGSLPDAVVEAVTLERCARIHLLARAAGGTEILPAEVEAGRRSYRPHYLRHMWEANVARARSGQTATGVPPEAAER